MKTIHLLALLLTNMIYSAHGLFTGFALESRLPNGQCRTAADWEFAFTKVASFPGNFKNARLYVSSECDTLKNAVPAAIKTGFTLVVGIWTENDVFFNNEKLALLDAIKTHGTQWIIGVVVGSEDLSRNDTSANIMATKIFDVRGMVNSVGVKVPVGHADTPEAWTNTTNAPLIVASDFLGINNQPYWKGLGVEDGGAQKEFFAATERVKAVSKGKDVWTTETGQPITGNRIGRNVPSQQAQQVYWWLVACPAIKQMNFFFYDLDDFNLNPQFAVVDEKYNLNLDLTCPQRTVKVQLPVQVPPPPAQQGKNAVSAIKVPVSPQLVAVTLSIPGALPTVMAVEFIPAPQLAPVAQAPPGLPALPAPPAPSTVQPPAERRPRGRANLI